MKLYWVNKCKDNNFRCYKCQNMIGDKEGQISANGKNHRIQMLDGRVVCVVCNSPVGYFPSRSIINKEQIKFGLSEKILENVEYVTPIEQKDF